MNDKLDMLLINPGTRMAIYGQVNKLYCIAPPIGIGMIAAYLRERGHSVEILDAQAEDLSPVEVSTVVAEKKPLLTGITAFTPQMTAATETIQFIKQKAPGVKTILGGHHSAALWARTLRETGVDFVCNTEGYIPTLKLLEELKNDPHAEDFSAQGICYIKNDEVIINAPPPLIADLDELPFVAWDLLPMDKYRAHNWHCLGHDTRTPYAVVFTGLGCPFNCSYCSVNVIYGKNIYRTRSPEHFVREIDLLVTKYHVKHMEIVDDTFYNKEKKGFTRYVNSSLKEDTI